MKGRVQVLLLPLGMMAVLGLFVLADRRPFWFADTTNLGAILALQVAFVSLTHFEEVFFPLLMGTFLWAGSAVPFSAVGMSLRWFFLAVGALGGFVIWLKSPRPRHFASFHLVASLCVVSALVSAIVSEVPRTVFLKAVSLFLLFLYASAGARVAIAGREHKFMNSLVLACELMVYVSAVCYFVLRFPVFGNPNSLGAIIGVVAVPILLWAALVAETRRLRQRRFFALVLCGGLLYLSNSRASILAAMAVLLVFAVALRHQRLLLQCAFVSLFFVTVVAVINPSHLDELFSSFTGRVVYKESGTYHGVLGSRLSPWSDTLSVVQQHPWFGSGFGTSDLGDLRPDLAASSVYTLEGTNREHGSSYLALAEYMGVLGAVPFVVLLFMLVRILVRICTWMRRTGNPHHYCIPLSLVAIAGLVHAGFEDWLFAVGYYLCVFFWVSVFVLMDLVPEFKPERARTAFHRPPGVASPAAVAHALGRIRAG